MWIWVRKAPRLEPTGGSSSTSSLTLPFFASLTLQAPPSSNTYDEDPSATQRFLFWDDPGLDYSKSYFYYVADFHFWTIFYPGSWIRLARINLCISLRWCKMCFFPELKWTWNTSPLQELAWKCIQEWLLGMIKGGFEIENLSTLLLSILEALKITCCCSKCNIVIVLTPCWN